MISVIMPTYNRAYLLQQSVNSILAQTFKDFELIIIDDASTDNTEELINNFQDVRIRYIKHSNNKGAAASRNTGWKNAKYEFITFLDSDDLWYDNYLNSQYLKFKDCNDNIGLQFCKYYFIYDNIKTVLPRNIENINNKTDVIKQMIEIPFITPQTIILKKKVLYDIGGFNEELKSLEDFDLALRIAFKYNIIQNFDILAEITLSTDSLSLMSERNNKSAHFIYNNNFDIFDQNKYFKIKYNYGLLLQSLYELNRIDLQALLEIIRINPFHTVVFKFCFKMIVFFLFKKRIVSANKICFY